MYSLYSIDQFDHLHETMENFIIYCLYYPILGVFLCVASNDFHLYVNLIIFFFLRSFITQISNPIKNIKSAKKIHKNKKKTKKRFSRVSKKWQDWKPAVDKCHLSSGR